MINITKPNNYINRAKEGLNNILNNKKYWGILFLILIIILLIWLLSYYLNNKLNLKITNDNLIKGIYDKMGGTSIGEISSDNSSHKHTLCDYYVASSYNSCCGGNFIKDFVSNEPLKQVIKQGARLLDFEIYSKNGEPIIAAGPGKSTNGKYCLKGTYNSLPFKDVMTNVKRYAFGLLAPNPNDPLFLSFRIKTNNKNIYPIMAEHISKTFSGKFLGPKYSNNGKYNDGTTVISNIPLLNLKNKVIIIVQDPTNNYKNTKFEEFINISGKGNEGKGMPFATFFRNIDIVQAYDTKSIISSCKKFLGITMPDFTKIKANPPAPIHHKFGCQFVMMNYSVLDANMMYYLNLFNKKGTSFVLKDEILRYKSRKISKPENQDPKLSFGPQQMQLLGGAYTPSL